MKINVEIDCTPEEARRVMGLPDLSSLHEKYLGAMGEAFDPAAHPEMIDGMIKAWAPMGENAMAFWRRMFEAGSKG